MYKQCKTEASALRQQQMTQGLLALMLEQNYHDLTVSDICRELRISRNSFYRYFSDKDSMLHALIDRMLLEFDSCVQFVGDAGELFTTDQQLRQVFRYWESCKPLLDALAFSGLSSILTQRAMIFCQKSGIFGDTFRIRNPNDQKYANFFTVGGLLSMLIAWHHEGFDRSIEEMVLLSRKLLTQPLFDSRDAQSRSDAASQ